MLYIYNQSENPWETDVIAPKNTVVKIWKTKTSVTDGTETSYSTSLLFQDNALPEMASLKDRLSKATKTTSPVRISETPTNFQFNRKGHRPFISNSREKDPECGVLLATIPLNYCDVISCRGQKDAFILEYMMRSGELSFCATMKEGAKITVVMLDRRLKKVYVRIFKYIDGVVQLQSSVRVAREDDLKAERATVLRYRPKRPTYLVMALEGQTEKAEAALQRYGRDYRVLTVNNGSIVQDCKSLAEEKYKAVTLYSETPELSADHTKVVDQLKLNFHLVRILTDDKLTFIKS